MGAGAWTAAEDARLRALYETRTRREIAAALGRSEASIRTRCWALGLNTKQARPWTTAETAALVALYRDHRGQQVPLAAFAAGMGRHKSNVSRKARELGLTEKRRLCAHARRVDGVWTRPRRYATGAELRAALSARTKARLAEQGHPRGALGLRHSDEAKRKMAAAIERWRSTLTPEERERIARKTVATKLEKYGTGRAGMASSNPYSRTRSGRREDLGIFVRSSWEANVARYLNLLVSRGSIRSWQYEADTFRFEGVKRGPYTYMPDFRVTQLDGTVVYWEVKGWMDSASQSRLKRMKQHFPEVEIRVIGLKEYQEIGLSAGEIPGWELQKR